MLPPAEQHHARVARMRGGEEVEVFDGRGTIASARISRITRDEVALEVGAPILRRESSLSLRLAMALIQLEKFELVLQKATELGVSAILPLLTDRGEVRVDRVKGKSERWEKIVLEAAKQSGRATIPRIEPPASFGSAIRGEGTPILFEAEAEPRPATSASGATLFIGPEGGWSEDEIRLAVESGAAIERLGPRRLRAETAAMAALTIIGARFGDLR